MSRERDLLQTALGILEDYEWGYGGDYHKSPEASILNDIRKLLAQPEQDNIQYLLDQVARLTAENAMLKEKWSTPKREPLSSIKILELTSKHEYAINLIRAVEKAHGIGGGE